MSLSRIFHRFRLLGVRVLRKKVLPDMDCDSWMSQAAVKSPMTVCFAEKAGALFATQVCAYFTNSGVPELVRYCGYEGIVLRLVPASP